MGKSLFRSKTFWFAVLTGAIALQPNIQAIADEGRLPTSGEWSQMVFAALGTAATIYGRYAADASVFTPKGLPGRDLEDIEQQAEILKKVIQGQSDAANTWGDANPDD